MKKILVCDDDEIMLTALAGKISSEKLGDVVKANDGKEARELLATQEFDLIITDLHMPFYSGLDVVTYVRSDLNKSTPIIVLSGEGLENIVLQAFEAGASDFITKPFSAKDLVTKIKGLILTEVA